MPRSRTNSVAALFSAGSITHGFVSYYTASKLLVAGDLGPRAYDDAWFGAMVQRLTLRLGLIRRQRHGSREGLDRHEYRPTELAHRLGISRDLVRRWLRVGWLNVRRDEDGHHIIWADAPAHDCVDRVPGDVTVR